MIQWSISNDQEANKKMCQLLQRTQENEVPNNDFTWFFVGIVDQCDCHFFGADERRSLRICFLHFIDQGHDGFSKAAAPKIPSIHSFFLNPGWCKGCH